MTFVSNSVKSAKNWMDPSTCRPAVSWFDKGQYPKQEDFSLTFIFRESTQTGYSETSWGHISAALSPQQKRMYPRRDSNTKIYTTILSDFVDLVARWSTAPDHTRNCQVWQKFRCAVSEFVFWTVSPSIGDTFVSWPPQISDFGSGNDEICGFNHIRLIWRLWWVLLHIRMFAHSRLLTRIPIGCFVCRKQVLQNSQNLLYGELEDFYRFSRIRVISAYN